MELAGDISNLLGSVTIVAAGSIIENANLDAKSVSITAGGSYVQNYSNALSSIGGETPQRRRRGNRYSRTP